MIRPSQLTAGHPANPVHTITPARRVGKAGFRKVGLAVLLLSATALAGCATTQKPPEIAYDDAAPAVRTVDAPAPVTVVELPRPLPLPGQMKPVEQSRRAPEPTDPAARVNQANAAARIQPVRDGFINAMQVYPYTGGALYQVYTAVGRSPTSRSSPAKPSSAPVPSLPATPCAGSSATRSAVRGRLNRCISWSSRRAPS